MVFQAVDTYVTPSWYATKREHGKVVPTWNYAIVQAWGRPRVIEDPAWLGAQIRALTAQQEAPRAEPWAVDDAPVTFVATQIKGIVGIEIAIARIEGKWKASQNRPPADREGVVAGLELQGDEASRAMAELVRERGSAVDRQQRRQTLAIAGIGRAVTPSSRLIRSFRTRRLSL